MTNHPVVAQVDSPDPGFDIRGGVQQGCDRCLVRDESYRYVQAYRDLIVGTKI
jgi:hypothetical protein